ncbi:hypothetical protein BKA18_006074 [Streptomyces auratus]
MSRSLAAHESKHACRWQRSPEGRFVRLNVALLVLHMVLALAAKPQLASDAVGQLTPGSLLLIGQSVLLLWTASRYASAPASEYGGEK